MIRPPPPKDLAQDGTTEKDRKERSEITRIMERKQNDYEEVRPLMHVGRNYSHCGAHPQVTMFIL
jgi:hypothetical protein